MEKLNMNRLIDLDYTRYKVQPVKKIEGHILYYVCEPYEATKWCVQGLLENKESGEWCIPLVRFEDQDLAYQFAELLTICLNQVKTFTNEHESDSIKWWNNLGSASKTRLCDTNTEIVGHVRRWETLTGREIEIIYSKEFKYENLQTETK